MEEVAIFRQAENEEPFSLKAFMPDGFAAGGREACQIPNYSKVIRLSP
jgi:hypothetical protein